jgi:large subunit ribosomal protein L6
VKIDGSQVIVGRSNDEKTQRALHGLLRSLVANSVQGVTKGFSRDLEIVGVGYKAEVKGKAVVFSLGYSHPVNFPIPEGISIALDAKAGKLSVSGADRQKVGQTAAEIRKLRVPDPYKAKGIKYADEVIRRKVGKAGGK